MTEDPLEQAIDALECELFGHWIGPALTDEGVVIECYRCGFRIAQSKRLP
jgi:hypothetical protein